jgi:hypothetical protein
MKATGLDEFQKVMLMRDLVFEEEIHLMIPGLLFVEELVVLRECRFKIEYLFLELMKLFLVAIFQYSILC